MNEIHNQMKVINDSISSSNQELQDKVVSVVTARADELKQD